MLYYCMQKIKMLLVEDDELACELVYHYFQDCGFDVTPVFCATDSIANINNIEYDIVLLDINLPDFTGFEVLKSIRNHISLPIIMTSARNDKESKLLAFKYGASDYIVKPIDLEELEARVLVHLRKNSKITTEENSSLFKIKGRQIYFKNKILDLTITEFELLSLLLKHENHVVKREELIHSISKISSPRSLDNHIKNIRKKLDDDGNKAIYLKTEYGVGYYLHVS